MNPTRWAFLLPDPQTLLDALGAKSVQTFHHRHWLVEEAQAYRAGHLGRKLFDRYPNPRVRIILILDVTWLAVNVPLRKADDFDRFLPL